MDALVAGAALLITLIRSPEGIAGTEYLKQRKETEQLAARQAAADGEPAAREIGPREAEKAAAGS